MVRAGSVRSASVTKWKHLPVPLTCFYGGAPGTSPPTVRCEDSCVAHTVKSVKFLRAYCRGRRPRRPVKLRAIFLCDKAQFTCIVPRHMDLLTFRVSNDTLSINRGNCFPVFHVTSVVSVANVTSVTNVTKPSLDTSEVRKKRYFFENHVTFWSVHASIVRRAWKNETRGPSP